MASELGKIMENFENSGGEEEDVDDLLEQLFVS